MTLALGAAELARCGLRDRLVGAVYRRPARLLGIRPTLVLVDPVYQAVAIAPTA